MQFLYPIECSHSVINVIVPFGGLVQSCYTMKYLSKHKTKNIWNLSGDVL